MTAAILAVLAVGLLVAGAAIGVWLLSREMSRDSLQQRFSSTGPLTTDTEPGSAAVWSRLAQQGRQLDALFDENGETELLLVQAGMRTPRERVPYFVAQILLPMIGLGFCLLAVWVADLSGSAKLMYSFGVVAVTLLAPRWWLRGRARRRQKRLQGEVPMLIHMLALLFDAGLSLRQALATLTTEGTQILPASSAELATILRQLESGADVGEVMGRLGRMLDVSELSSVLAVLQQVDRYGGELRAPLMDVLELVEKRRELSMREKVSELSGRMTVVMVLFFFPALLVFVAGPAFLAILAAMSGVQD